jgi:uncharacterized protein YggT (Ycf19 family)
MGIIDLILNLAGLLLWLNWRAEKADPVGKRKPATLVGTLRRPDSKSTAWQLPSLIAGLLLLRALFYWQIGATTSWSGKLNLEVIVLSFPVPLGSFASLGRTVLFSVSSFALTLGVFYLCLLLLSILNGPEPFRTFVRQQLGAVDRWNRSAKVVLPFVAASLLWWLASWLFAWLQIVPPPVSAWRRADESLLIGLGSYLTWKYVATALLVLHGLNSYIYFGRHPFWNFVNAEAQTLLSPLKKIPLRAGKIDLAPIVGIALVLATAWLAGNLLAVLHTKLPV